MHYENLHKFLESISILTLVVLVLILLLKRFRQPYLIAYILAGVLLGPNVTGTFTNVESIRKLGEIGILLHLFFMGTKVEVPDSGSALIKPILAQLLKMVLSISAAITIGYYWMDWPTGNIVILVFILIFNSTAVVSEYLEKTDELHTPLGNSH